MARGRIGHRARRIEDQPQARTPHAVSRVPLDPLDEELVEHILRNHEAERTGGRHYIVDPSRRLGTKTHIAKRGFADGTNFELETVGSRKCGCATRLAQ